MIGIVSVFVAHAGGSYDGYHTQHVEYYSGKQEVETAHDQDSAENAKEVVGYWLGDGAKRLGLTLNPIFKDDSRVAALFKGIHPNDGSKLRRGMTTVRRYIDPKTGEEKTHKPVVAFDLTFSGPKSIDILAAIGPSKVQRLILKVYARTIAEQVDSLARQIGYTRTGPGGRNRERAGLICAAFLHQANRDGEPKVHVHLVVFNVGIKADGQGGTLDSRHLLKKDFIHRQGQEFRDHLALNFQNAFGQDGLTLEQVKIKNGISYRVVGIPDAICDAFSKRRLAIKKELESLESPTVRQVQTAVLKTRNPKPERINLTELRKKWEAIAKEHDFDASAFLEKARERRGYEIRFQAMVAEHDLKLSPFDQARAIGQHIWQEYNHYPDDETIQSRSLPKAPDNAVSQKLKLSQQLLKGLLQSRLFRRLTLDEKIERALQKADRQAHLFRRKFFFLYATGQINRRTYLKYTQDKGRSKTALGIEFQYWTGRINLSERIRLRVEHQHGLPKVGMPKTKPTINLAYAMGQISQVQRLLMLKRREEEKANRLEIMQQKKPRRSHKWSR
jgi:conjugative relaxase-like TrwC/TraI family protein